MRNKPTLEQKARYKKQQAARYARLKNDPEFRRRRRVWRNNLKDWVREYSRKRRNSPRGMAFRLLGDARGRAKKFGFQFNLTVEDCTVPKLCPVFGVPIRRGKGKPHRFSPTLDRLDPKKGYVKGNVAVISQYANALKHNGTAAQHRRIADWMEEQENKNVKFRRTR